jgi:hypothetical protein
LHPINSGISVDSLLPIRVFLTISCRKSDSGRVSSFAEQFQTGFNFLGGRAMLSWLMLMALFIGADPAADVPLKEVEITLPTTIGKLKFKQRQDYDKFGPGLGYSVGYNNPASWGTIYVYDRTLTEIPSGKEGKLIEQELKTAGSDLELAEKKGIYKNLKRIEEEPQLPKSVLEKFAVSAYTYEYQGRLCKSYTLVTGYKGRFVKIRATQYFTDEKTNDEEFFEFLEEIATHVKLPEE